MKFYSPIAAAEYRRRVDLEQQMKAAFENAKKAY